ncbi:MAG: methyltransferase domain-containing protein [Actinomycetota bacterium]
MRNHDGYRNFGPGFFERTDELPDGEFYRPPRFVQHIDDGAIAGVGALYHELALNGRVLDLMSSWVSHFRSPPEHLTALGMNPAELVANEQAAETLVHDLNVDPLLPWPDDHFDDATCVVSVDYLVQPLEVFEEVRRVVRPGGRFVCTFSNRCFPTKAIRGWLIASESFRTELVATYFRLTGWDEPTIETRIVGGPVDPLYAVWATHGSSEGDKDT